MLGLNSLTEWEVLNYVPWETVWTDFSCVWYESAAVLVKVHGELLLELLPRLFVVGGS